jgi:transposase
VRPQSTLRRALRAIVADRLFPRDAMAHCQSGWAVSTKRDNYLSALYRGLAARRGGKRAVMAVAHAILVMAFHMLKRKEDYREAEADYLDRLNADRLKRSLVRRLERLGHKVTLQPLAQPA